MEQQSLLSDIEFNPVYASTGKRFLNYLIDFVIYYALTFCVGILIAAVGTTYLLNNFSVYLVAYATYFLYYFVCETVFSGKTVGKFITGTKAVNEDGTAIEPKTALLRTLCRLVPFEPLSAFGGHPWHDKWTKTMVIDVRQTAMNDIAYQQ